MTSTGPGTRATTRPCAPSPNRLVGILDGCLRTHTPYDELEAWGHRSPAAATTKAAKAAEAA